MISPKLVLPLLTAALREYRRIHQTVVKLEKWFEFLSKHYPHGYYY